MRELKKEMQFISEKLNERGNENHAAEMQGAAAILQTWVDGIQAEHAGQAPSPVRKRLQAVGFKGE